MIARVVRVWLTLFSLLGAISTAAADPTTRPTVAAVPTTAPVGAHEKQTIQHPAGAGATTRATSPISKVVPTDTGLDTTRVALSLVLVIAIIFLLRWIAQQFFGAPTTKRSSRAVQVLSRSMIAPKQHVLVLQVGRRVIVVGDSGTQMNPLCEITDADEIASLMGQLRQDKADPVSRAFGTFFGRAENDYHGDDAAADRPRAGESAEASTELAAVDPELATTRAELNGLIDKVRNMSRQMRQG